MRFFHGARKILDKGIDRVFETVLALVSNRYWAVGIILISICWFCFETFVARRPLEGWFNGWLYTVFVYTVLTLWIDALNKVQTAHIAKIQQEQSDRMEFMLRYLVEQTDTIKFMLKDNQQKDAILRHLVGQWKELTQMLLEKKIIV